ncbi:hypothetical protein LINPERHAP2_LOCUS42274 [Linum perenne]
MRKINLCVNFGSIFLKMASSATSQKLGDFWAESTIYLRRRASKSSIPL